MLRLRLLVAITLESAIGIPPQNFFFFWGGGIRKKALAIAPSHSPHQLINFDQK